MCGILGIVAAPGNTVAVSDSRLRAMRDRMTARGPDDAGEFLRENVAFAHRRLSIRDLEAGRQPWVSADGECVLTYNGELYNDAELRRELESLGHRFTTRCDTETLMAAYREWGADCVLRLRGMFAFGAYDFRDDSLLLARDRFGVKPLFLAEVGGTLVFASSIPAILAHPRSIKRPHLPAVSHLLSTFRLTLGRSTVYEGVRQLLPAETLMWKDGKLRIERYWDYPDEEGSHDYESAVHRLRETLGESVRRRLVSDVPVGLFLSGGVDSSTIACLVRESTDQPMIARCGVGGDDRSGDAGHARRCADFGGFDFGEVRVSPSDYFECWRELLADYQTPVSTPTDVVLHRLAQEMKERVGVVLGGEGADEALCGYAVQHWAGHEYDDWRRLRNIRDDEAFEGFRQALQQQYGRASFHSRADHFFALNSLIPGDAKAALFQPWAWKAAERDEVMHAVYSGHLDEPGDGPTARRYKTLLHRVNLEGLLARLDTATMAANLEARVPYTDHALVEAMFRVPMRHQIDAAHSALRGPHCAAVLHSRDELRSKRLLRSVAAELMPAELAQRKKASFPTPVARWLQNDWSNEVRATLTTSEFGRALFRPAVLSELADNLPAAGMWLWPLMNVLHWGDREFA
ncbi:MAG: asparagine synthase (glutamine-hydrolyzing) [Planctomycetaceae bacterium]